MARKIEDPACPFSTVPELPPTPARPGGIFRGGSSAVHAGCGVSGTASARVFGGGRPASAKNACLHRGPREPPSWQWLVADSLDPLKRARKWRRRVCRVRCLNTALRPAWPGGIFRGASRAVHTGCGLSGSAGDVVDMLAVLMEGTDGSAE
ncbi:hypothetical protein DV515_00019023 [Chloebia gouldiae]|uniref:Uncharacterized protein n=1 Tax=Chloebia gouldiae TaxID=44316 RepID=A0A3L8Q6N4_CHLGU|nr:hypothetical protein DV515_00019023 [Chloebia gouldiae]